MQVWRSRVTSLLLVLLLLLGGAGSGLAQGNIALKLEQVDAGQLPQMTARVTVVDENGLPVLGLGADNFEVTEDGRTSVKPTTVKAIADEKAPLSALILIDLSATMKGEPLTAAKEATARFLDKLLDASGDADRAGFIGFGADVDIKALTIADGEREAGFSNDKGRLLNVVNFVEIDAGVGTPLYDALYRAVKIMAGQAGRRAIIVMTDGADVGSVLKDNDPIDEARRQHIPIFPVGLSNSRLDATYLKRLAELTGGQYQEAPGPKDVTQKFEEILADLKVGYLLTYPSQWSKLDAATHSVLVRVTTPRGQAFDEMKVQLVEPSATAPATPATALAGATDAPTIPAPTATPTTEVSMIETLRTWVTDNTLLAAGIGVAAVLFILLIILAIVLARRRAAGPAAAPESVPPPAWAPAETPPATPAYADDLRVGGAAAGGTTVSADASTPAAGGTWVAPVEQPIARQPFGFPPAPAHSQAEPEEEGTMVLPRGPRAKVLGLLIDRDQPARRYDLDKPTVSIGRAAGNVIALDDPTISRQHAVVKFEDGEFRVYDLGSANGTFVNGVRVRDPIALADGAAVRFGEAQFVFKRLSLQ